MDLYALYTRRNEHNLDINVEYVCVFGLIFLSVEMQGKLYLFVYFLGVMLG